MVHAGMACALRHPAPLPPFVVKSPQHMCRHHEEYLDVCRCLRAIYETPSVAADKEARLATLRQICWCAQRRWLPESEPD